MNAEQLFENLKKDGILQASGKIEFSLLNTKTTVKSRSVVGDVIQDWLWNYMKNKNIFFKEASHTQKFPDFYLQNGTVEEMLEIKCFDGDRSANFDVANFQAYCNSLLENPIRLDSKYLIFSYTMNDEHYDVSIKNIWLKNVWEICGPSEDWPIKLQVKKGVVYNIRPISWDSKKSKFKAFKNPSDFLEALNKAMKRNISTHDMYRHGWLDSVKSSYKSMTGKSL